MLALIKAITTIPSKTLFLKFTGPIVLFVASGVILFVCTDEDISIFWDFFYNSSLYRFFADIFFTSHEVDSSTKHDNSTKKEEASEKKSEESADEEQKTKTPNKFFKPETSTVIKAGLIVGTVIGAFTLIYKIFFKNGK